MGPTGLKGDAGDVTPAAAAARDAAALSASQASTSAANVASALTAAAPFLERRYPTLALALAGMVVEQYATVPLANGLYESRYRKINATDLLYVNTIPFGGGSQTEMLRANTTSPLQVRQYPVVPYAQIDALDAKRYDGTLVPEGRTAPSPDRWNNAQPENGQGGAVVTPGYSAGLTRFQLPAASNVASITFNLVDAGAYAPRRGDGLFGYEHLPRSPAFERCRLRHRSAHRRRRYCPVPGLGPPLPSVIITHSNKRVALHG